MQIYLNERKEIPKAKSHLYFILGLIILTIVFMIIRVLIMLNIIFQNTSNVQHGKDFDYLILYEGMGNGIVNFYDSVSVVHWKPYYLYFWYFIFFPMYLLPIEIGVYIWDLLRLISVSYVFIKAKEMFKDDKDLFLFYLLCLIGYCYDGYFNNANFIVLFLLFFSYRYYERERKIIAGILFTLATFKINSLLFLLILLICKEIKWRDLIYFLIPFFLICIPYIIFPNYFLQMIDNWVMRDDNINGFLFFDSFTWKIIQPSHLMFISFMILVFLSNLQNISLEHRKRFFRYLLPIIILIYFIYLTIIRTLPFLDL